MKSGGVAWHPCVGRLPGRRCEMTHFSYVAIAYGVTGLTVLALIAWVLLDQRARRAELANLEASGIRRRSDAKGGADEH